MTHVHNRPDNLHSFFLLFVFCLILLIILFFFVYFSISYYSEFILLLFIQYSQLIPTRITVRNTLRGFLKLSRQSPRSRASTDFGSLLTYTRCPRYRGSRQGLVRARTLARCSRKKNRAHISLFLKCVSVFYRCTTLYLIF